MNFSCDRRGGYGDSAEEATNFFSAAPTRNTWQGAGQLNPLSAGHHGGNTTYNGVGIAEGGAGQGAIIFQGFLGGRGYGGLQPSSAGLHARWGDINPVQLGENQTSGNQRDDQEQAKWNIPSARLRDDDELLGYSVDQRPGQPNCLHNSPCAVVYKDCQKNQALDSANHCVDGCGEFMRRGRDGQEALQCMACGCHRSYHRSIRVGDDGKELETDSPDDLHNSLSRIETVALNLMEATGRALPFLAGESARGAVDDLAQKELDTVMKISIENLDHISKVTLSTVECIGILQTAASTTPNSRHRRLRNLDSGSPFPSGPDNGRLSSEVSPVSTTDRRRPQVQQFYQQVDRTSGSQRRVDQNGHPGKPKRKRTQFTDEQRGKMKAYAEHAGWTIVGQRKENIVAACKDIGVTPKTLKYWIHNAKQKLKRSNEQPL